MPSLAAALSPSFRAAPARGAADAEATLSALRRDSFGPQGDGSARESDGFAHQGDAFRAKPPRPCHICQMCHVPLARLVLAALALLIALLLAPPLAAKDSLGVFARWGAFRDSEVPRCYAIAAAEGRASSPAFASVGTWPRREVRGQVHLRLSRTLARSATISLSVGGERFALTGSGGDAWAADRRMDAAIVAAMRSAETMTVTARDAAGRRFTDRYSLDGAATAMDAATVGCARIR